MSTWRIAHRIVESSHRHALRPALSVKGQTWAYWELLAAAHHLCMSLPQSVGSSQPAMATAIMADRQPSSYIGILASILKGHTYVPIHVHHPATRNALALRRAGVRQVICGTGAWPCLRDILEANPDLQQQIRVILIADQKSGFPLRLGLPATSSVVDAGEAAYILFTSGSTGEPKGVAVSHGNLTAYLDAVSGIMDVTCDDRLSQSFELTFDLSVHDLLVSWTNGAHLIVPQPCDLASPADFIRNEQITCWFSVPTLAYQMQMQGRLTPGAFPSLRWSMFCGEALPLGLARQWMAAAPQSRVENWYGPTEATIACARFDLSEGLDETDAPNDLAPIGRAFPGMTLTVAGEDLHALPEGQFGELLLSGPQVTAGYLNDPERTAKSFVRLPHHCAVHYRTGDRAVCDRQGRIWFLGRIDNQVKIRGFRVELGAIESVVRQVVPVNVVAMSWPPESASGSSVVVALETAHTDPEPILALARRELPDYMVPSRIVCVPTFPTNASGKADRKGIATWVSGFLAEQRKKTPWEELGHDHAILMQAMMTISPHLDPGTILQAEHVLSAGMDSLGFVMLTAEIEKIYGIELSQERVQALAEMPFDAMVRWIQVHAVNLAKVSPRVTPAAVSTPEPTKAKTVSGRANRVMQFIEQIQKVVVQDEPVVLAIGSSGIFWGFDPSLFDHLAAEAGHRFTAYNVGLPAIDSQGIARICRFVKEQFLAAGVRLPLAVYELDPMLISVIPPKGELVLGDEHFNGGVRSVATRSLNDDFRWNLSLRGAPRGVAIPTGTLKQPKWQLDREVDIARTFLGGVEFSLDAQRWWLDGAHELAQISDRVVGFVHPLRKSSLSGIPAHEQGDRWRQVFASLKARSGIEFMDWESVALDVEDFINMNHVNTHHGRRKLTGRFAQWCFMSSKP